jgi:hypothetical protein
MKEKVLGAIAGIGLYLLKKVLLFDLVLVALVGVSFLIWPGFSWDAMSERTIWAGLCVALIAGILVFGQTSGGRDFGVPGQFIQTAHASTMFEWNREIRRSIETRFGFRFQIFMIGAIAFVIGMLIQIIGSKL